MAYEFLDAGGNPRLYTDKETTLHSKGVVKTDENILTTILVVFVSAMIFITLVAWVDFIKSYLDAKIIDKFIEKQTKSRFIFSMTVSFISILVFVMCALIYQKFHKDKNKKNNKKNYINNGNFKIFIKNGNIY